MTTEEMLDSFRTREAASTTGAEPTAPASAPTPAEPGTHIDGPASEATPPTEEVDADADFPPCTELDAETAKAVSAHLLAGLEAGDVIAEGGEMHTLMVTITLAEYRKLVANHASDARIVSDYYVARVEADTAKKELAEAKKRIDSLTQQLLDLAMKGGTQ